MVCGREWPLLAALTDDDRARVLAATRRRTFGRGQVLFHEGDPGDALYLIEAGHVAIRTTTEAGDVVTLIVFGPGECFGEQALLTDDAKRTGAAIAVERAETLVLQRDDFVRLREERPAIDRFLVDELAAQVRRMSSLLVEALHAPVDTRVVRRLAALGDLYRNGDTTVIPLTQEDVATMAGVTRSTVNRVLQRLANEGLIKVSRGRITVLQPAALAARAK